MRKSKKLSSLERQQRIIDYLRKHKHAEVSYLSEMLKVSEVTVRKDLDKLETDRIVIRSHGGASLNENLFWEPSFFEKEEQNVPEKKAIAAEAAKLVGSDMVIALSTGTTIRHMPSLLRDRKGLTVVTNAVNIANQLMHAPGIQVILTGGRIRPNTYALVGEAAVRSLKDIYCQYAFIGTNGIDLEHGVTTPNMEEAGVVRTLINSARQTILLADHSKFGQIAFYRVCPVEKIDILITDHRTPCDLLRKYEERGIRVIVAKPESKTGIE